MGRTIHVDSDRFQAKMRTAGPRTADDVSVTKDGRRLGSRQSVLPWLAELEADALELNHQRYAEEVAAGLHDKNEATSRPG